MCGTARAMCWMRWYSTYTRFGGCNDSKSEDTALIAIVWCEEFVSVTEGFSGLCGGAATSRKNILGVDVWMSDTWINEWRSLLRCRVYDVCCQPFGHPLRLSALLLAAILSIRRSQILLFPRHTNTIGISPQQTRLLFRLFQPVQGTSSA